MHMYMYTTMQRSENPLNIQDRVAVLKLTSFDIHIEHGNIHSMHMYGHSDDWAEIGCLNAWQNSTLR